MNDSDDKCRKVAFGNEGTRTQPIVRHMSNRRTNKGIGDEEVVLVPATNGSDGTASSTESTLPLRQSVALATTYVASSLFFFLMLRYTKRKNLRYDDTCIVLGIETAKLMVSVALKYREDGEFLLATVFSGPTRRAMWLSGLPYAVPSLLYAVYNNLTFVNLRLFNISTYQVFMQTRILCTALFSTLLLKQMLTVREWSALLLLMIGLASKYYSPSALQWDSCVFLIFFQVLLSSSAGVYNEYVLKKELYLSIHQQNFFMYLYAIVFNTLFGLLTHFINLRTYLKSKIIANNGQVSNMEMDSPVKVHGTHRMLLVLLICSGAVTGISAAFILKFTNVIVKAFASAVEVVLASMFSAALLGEALTAHDIIAAVIVMISVYTYYTRSGSDAHTLALRR